ncbi:MAG: M1 family metallopeptidase [Acidimicrobiales bacterium]
MTNAYRLPRAVVPSHYSLVLAPDLVAGVFDGTVDIDATVATETATISLNALDLEIRDAWLEVAGERVALRPTIDAADERLHLDPSRTLTPGPLRIHLEFAGGLNDRLRGFYRSTFVDDGGTEQVLATTQFEATDARRAFPCWDEPDFKATFAITMVVDESATVVSNALETRSTPTGDGRRRVEFATTMPMSTYLVAFIVGPLSVTPAVDVAGTPLRVVARPDRAHLTPFALDVAQFCLRYFADYFDRPYPGDKLDLVAIPDFAFGAMENLGCVTFRETALLVDPDAATQPELQRVVDVIAHELAHMWFGDLVTMQWWNGIWLNEAFATFMEMKATDAYRPDWQRWTDFGLSRTAAFDVDSLVSTRPIEFEVLSPTDAEAMFDVLTYEKGAAVVRMLEQFLGEEQFRLGIRQYMQQHAYGNTETSDLWVALEAASGEPVRRTMESWIFQGGYPVIAINSLADDAITVEQARFAFDSPLDDSRWSIPLRLRVSTPSGPHESRVLLEDRSMTIAMPEGARVRGNGIINLNVDSSGFYRAQLPEAVLDDVIANGPSGLSPIERYSFIDDAWALTVSSRLEATRFIEILDGFRDDRDLSVWQRIIGALDTLWRVVAPSDRPRFQQRVDALVRPAYDALSQRALGDDRSRQLRATLFGALGRLADDPATIDRARTVVRDGDDDPALLAASIGVVAIHATSDEYGELIRRMQHATSPQDEERFRSALADVADPKLFANTLAMCADGRIRTQDGPYLLARAMQNRFCGFDAWLFVTSKWDLVVARFPSNSISRMLAGIVALAEPDQVHNIEAFLDANPPEQGQLQIRQHRERLLVQAALRIRERERLGINLIR